MNAQATEDKINWEEITRAAMREIVDSLSEREELSKVRAELISSYNQCLTDLEIARGRLESNRQHLLQCLLFLEDYLAGHNHPGVSRLVSDIKETLHRPN